MAYNMSMMLIGFKTFELRNVWFLFDSYDSITV